MKVKFFTSVFAKKVFKTKGSQIQSVLTICFVRQKRFIGIPVIGLEPICSLRNEGF